METTLCWRVMVGLVFACLLGACAGPGPAAESDEAVTIELTGSAGASVHGAYIADGNRSEFSAALPVKLQIHGITMLAIGKNNRGDAVQFAVRVGSGFMGGGIPANNEDAMVLNVAGGLSAHVVPASALTSPARNALIVIKPYWYEGTWVFDDAATGLVREPFVQGVPDMINTVVQDIPNARQGFRLTASDKEFPGYQKQLAWVRAEAGGNYYRLSGTSMEGWLCPAMFRYFDHTPKMLYVKAEAIGQ